MSRQSDILLSLIFFPFLTFSNYKNRHLQALTELLVSVVVSIPIS